MLKTGLGHWSEGTFVWKTELGYWVRRHFVWKTGLGHRVRRHLHVEDWTRLLGQKAPSC